MAAFTPKHPLVSLGGAQLTVIGLNPQRIGTMSEARVPGLPTFGGMDFQTTGLGDTASDLDDQGYRMMMLLMEGLGFSHPALDGVEPGLADRPGFTSPRQVALIKALWAEWAGSADEAALNAWLERYYRVSALRFLPSGSASKAITALKARGAGPSKVTA